MSKVLNDALNRGRKQNSFYPVSDQDLAEEATNMPDIPITKASDQDSEQSAQIIQPAQAQTQDTSQPTPQQAGNKWGYSDDEMAVLAKAGYTPDKLERLNADFDPNSGESFLQRIYEASMPKPTAPDEKQLKRNQLIAGVGDALSLMSQMWSAGKGAYVKERDYKSSATAQVAEKEKNLQNIYLQQLEKYNAGLFDARGKDLLNALAEHKAGRKDVRDVLSAHRKETVAAAKQALEERKFAQGQQNKDADRALKEENQKSLERHRKVLEAQGWSRVDDSRSRTSAYVKRTSSGSSTGKSSTYQVMFPAHPNDRDDVREDSFGNPVKVIDNMNKGEVDKWFRGARNNPDFQKAHPELYELKTDPIKGTIGLVLKASSEKERLDVAVAYMKDQYDRGFSEGETQRPQGAPRSNYDWNQVQLQHPNWDWTPRKQQRTYKDGDGWTFEKKDDTLDSAIL